MEGEFTVPSWCSINKTYTSLFQCTYKLFLDCFATLCFADNQNLLLGQPKSKDLLFQGKKQKYYLKVLSYIYPLVSHLNKDRGKNTYMYLKQISIYHKEKEDFQTYSASFNKIC